MDLESLGALQRHFASFVWQFPAFVVILSLCHDNPMSPGGTANQIMNRLQCRSWRGANGSNSQKKTKDGKRHRREVRRV